MTEQEQIKCYGETIESLKSVPRTRINATDDVMYAMGIISDAQHIINSDPETARQWMNKAKYYLGEVNSELREMEREGKFG